MSPIDYSSSKHQLVHQALKAQLQTKNFEIKSIVSREASDSLLGFLGDHIRFTVQYITNGIESKAYFFVKGYPEENQSRCAFNDEYKTFEREITIYTKIWGQLEIFKESEEWHPKCLAVTEDTLAFEDLAVRGFKMLEVRNTFDTEHCLAALTSIARLHSASIILEERESIKTGKTFRLENEFGVILGESAIAYNDWMKTGLETVLEIIESCEKYQINCDIIQQGIKDVYKQALNLLKPSKTYRNVLIHMDLWNNNIMFRYKDEKPVQCMLVDFQACRLLPPAVDVISILHLNLNRKLRNEKFELFLKHYYDELARKLKENKIDPEKILSWREFRISCDIFRIWGPIHALTLHQFTFLSADETLNVIKDSNLFRKLVEEKRTEKLKLSLNTDRVLKKRYMSYIDELVNESIIIK